jgi:glycosyltransferase involved in cell wall biosynthesis
VKVPAVLFVLVQTNAAADGGIASISHVLGGLRRHRPIIVTDRPGERVDQWRRQGIETHVIPQSASKGLLRNPLATIRSYVRYASAIRHILRSSDARLVHANDPLSLQLSLVPGKLAGAKLLFNLRGTFDPARPPWRLKYRLLIGFSDHVLFLSRDMARRWEEFVGRANAGSSVTYSIVDAQRFGPAPLPKGGKPIILVCGLVRPLKGQLEFLRNVAPRLVEHGNTIWFAGDFDPRGDAYMAACAEAATSLGPAVQFLGYRNDIPELMREATVVAVPSRHEGLVRAMIEAMSCARPVVSFDISSAREMLEDESGGAGMVVEWGDFAGMAEAILRYCNDRALASAAGEKGVAAARRLFSPAAVTERYERAYDLLASEDRAGPKKSLDKAAQVD